MKIIIAGSDTRNCSRVVIENKLCKLYSMLNERKLIENWNDENFLMVDSGAHSWNKENITPTGMKRTSKLKPADEFLINYLEFIKTHKDKKVVWVEFDVYGCLDRKLIDDFYDEVQKIGIKGKMIRVYHPMLDNGDFKTLKKWIDDGHEYIGIGNDSTPYLDDIFNLTKDKVKLHGFAMTKLGLMEKYPFFSVDSTSPLSTVIFGRYTRPIMAFNEREDIFKAKSIECYDDDWQRLEKAILETKKTQEYITELWSKRGIVWESLKY